MCVKLFKNFEKKNRGKFTQTKVTLKIFLGLFQLKVEMEYSKLNFVSDHIMVRLI